MAIQKNVKIKTAEAPAVAKAPAPAAAEPVAKAEKAQVLRVSRKDLAQSIVTKIKAQGMGLPVPLAEKIVLAYEESVADALVQGAEVNLPGFGKFVVKNKPAGTARNPATGEQAPTAAKNIVRFKVGGALKSVVNQ